ncbi:hypothetical protein ABFX02_13G108700 [Erythranthe guttata]
MAMACLDCKIRTWVVGVFVISSALSLAWGVTDPRDVYAISELYASLGSPLLPGWILGGDPCGPVSWQGVSCVYGNITAIKLDSLNLGGLLSEGLASFASIIQIDLSNNQIGGGIPANLPTTLRSFYLSDNQFTGLIPGSISSSTQLTELFLNNNQFTGPIPDAFEPLTSLINLDLSGNTLSGALPPSMGNLSSLKTLNLENNLLSGVLDVLQYLPLNDLNIENNQFSGPIPNNLLNIPDFRGDGNPFNTSIIPSPPALSPLSPSDAPSPQSFDGPPGPSASPLPDSGRSESKKHASNKTTWIVIAGLFALVALALGLCLSMSTCCCKRRGSSEETLTGTHKQDHSSQNSFRRFEAASKQVNLKGDNRNHSHSIDMKGLDDNSDLQTSPLPFPLLPAERIVADPTFTPSTARANSSKIVESSKLFTIASLQQCTNSFSQENLIGQGMLGAVYRGRLPDGRVIAIKKLDKAVSANVSDREFVEMVTSVSKIKHENIVDFLGYCLEHGQRLLVYSYCRNGTLDEALNTDDEINKKLSWNARMRLALQAAKALEYLHEVCQPPIVHRNFKSCNVLLEDDLTVRVSDCGLSPLLSTNSMAQLQGSGYGAPELELGSYSHHSDVYSFGVVMLQLLTGRKSYDRLRPRGEQYLVRWAYSQLYDIDALSRMVDPSLNGSYPSKSLSRVADIISLCIQAEPEFRPPMSEIVQKLLNIIQKEPRLPRQQQMS